MFPQPFQAMSLNDVSGVVGWFIFWLLFFGTPSLLIIWGISCLKVFRHLPFRFVVVLFPLMGLLFGLSTGFFNVWDDHHYWSMGMPATQNWYEALTILGWPGDSMANSYGGDWQADEEWVYRSDITLLNGLVWMSIAIAGIFVVRFVRRRGRLEPHSPNTARDCVKTPCAISGGGG